MPRQITLFTGQWSDLALDVVATRAAAMGFDGLELACWGDHVDVPAVAGDKAAARGLLASLERHKLRPVAISSHLVSRAVCDTPDARHRVILPERVWGDGEPEGVRQRAAAEMKLTIRAAANLGVRTVVGFTGSSIWKFVYPFPPVSKAEIDAGYADFAERWGPILDLCRDLGIRYALEVHPGEIAYDYYTAEHALEAVGGHPAFGFNFDPSHLLWQGVAPNKFLERFAERIFHVHAKDCAVHYGPGNHRGGDGMAGVLGSHLPFGDVRRGWDFRSVGRGHLTWEAIIRALNRIGYDGPLSVECEDPGMDREHSAKESLAYLRRLDFPPSA
jgi:sugar phosphate isomerase/epimerase